MVESAFADCFEFGRCAVNRVNSLSSPSDLESAGNPLHCWYLTGATASGKTRIGIELAQRLDAEIISLDSMAIYREMDIGTAKPSPADCAQVPHHLVDIVNPDEEFSLAQYLSEVQRVMCAIQARGKEVLFVGGTSLYLKALLRGVDEGPPPDWGFRREVEAEVERVGLEALRKRLEQVDPLSAAKLHPNDQRRIIRALEVYKVTGQPISHSQTHFDAGRDAEDCKVFTLSWPRPTLHERIEQRVETMFQRDFVEEVRALVAKYPQLSRTASQAVGYSEVIRHLAGQASLELTLEKVKTRTRQFARRQETWFRHLSECRFVDLTQEADPQVVAEMIHRQGDGAGDPA